MLDKLYNQSMNAHTSPTKQGLPNQSNTEVRITPTKQVLLGIIEKALRSSCVTLHSCVYGWMMTKNMNGELIAMAAPSLEQYLMVVSAPHLRCVGRETMFAIQRSQFFYHGVVHVTLIFHWL